MAIGDPYVTLDEAKDYTTVTDAVDDALILRCVGAASRAIEQYTRRQFNKETVATPRRFRPVDWRRLPVADFHTTTGLVVNVSGTTWSLSNVDPRPWNGIVDGQTGWPFFNLYAVNTSWPYFDDSAAVTVTAQWGWAAVPDAVKQATLIQATRLFGRKFSPQGVVTGQGDFVFRVSTITDPDVKQMLDRYRLRNLVFA